MVSDFMYGSSDLSADEQEENETYGSYESQNEAPMSEETSENTPSEQPQAYAQPAPSGNGGSEEKAGGFRVLAGLFALLAVGGLFVGLLGKWIAFLAFPTYTLAEVLPGSLLGYILFSFKSIFTVGLGNYIGEAEGSLAIVNLLSLLLMCTVLAAAVASVVLFIVSLCSRKAAKNCATASGVLTAIGYFGTFLLNYSMLAVGAKIFSKEIFSMLDPVLGIFGGAAVLMLMISAIVRRKGRGVIQCVQFVLPLATLFALTYPSSVLGATALVLIHYIQSVPFVGIALLLLTLMLLMNLVASLIRLGAKRAYGFDCLRFALLFVAVVLSVVAFMVQGGDGASYLFTGDGQLLPTLLLLCTSLASLIVGIVQFVIGPAKEEAVQPAAVAQSSESVSAEETESTDTTEEDFTPQYEPETSEVEEQSYGQTYAEEPIEAAPVYGVTEEPEPVEETPAEEPVAAYEEPQAVEEAPAEVPEEPEEDEEATEMPPLFAFEDLFATEPEDTSEAESAEETVEEAEPEAEPEPEPEPEQEPAPEPEPEPQPEPAPEPPAEPVREPARAPESAPAYGQPPYGAPYPPYSPAYKQPETAPYGQPYAPYGQQGAAYPPYTPAYGQQSYGAPYRPAYPQPRPQPVSPENAFTQWEREMAALAAGRAPEPAPQPQPQPDYSMPRFTATPRQTRQPSYFEGINQYTYDPFINSLTQQEKNEFGDIFIARKNGRAKNMPVYVIGGDNDEFFRTVWIRYNSFGMSPSLKEKVYQYLTSKD